MSDRVLDRQIDVLSGRAEARALGNIQEEKYRLLGDRTRQKQASRDRARTLIEMAASRASKVGLLPTIAALTDHERRNYSPVRLVESISKVKREPCLEIEISDSISQDLGQVPAHGGAWLPWRISGAGLDTKTSAGGGYTVATEIGNIIDGLRQRTAVLRLGARLISTKNNVALPTENAILAASWVSDNPGSDTAASDPSFGQRSLVPHNLIATTSVSRQLLAQATPDISMWIIERIAKAIGLALDSAAINGSGASNQPRGILQTSGIGSVAIGANGGAVSAANLINLEALLGSANAGDSLSLLTTTAQRSKMRAIPEFTAGTDPLWSDDGTVLGYPSLATNQVPSNLIKGSSGAVCSAIILADFSALIIYETTGALEIVADEFSMKKQNLIEISSFASFDTGVTTLGSFAAIQDAI